jgi:hypothetical protein
VGGAGTFIVALRGWPMSSSGRVSAAIMMMMMNPGSYLPISNNLE